MIAIIDYGLGNLRSVQKGVEKAGARAVITQNPSDIKGADKIIFPGVGAIEPSMKKLQELEIIPFIKEAVDSGKPFLGICVGFQLLFESSEEGGDVKALGILNGSVKKFPKLKVPQIGWNSISIKKDNCPLFKGIDEGAYVYFCHSYYAEAKEDDVISSTTDYGIEYCSSIWRDNLFGVQFHPEKSQAVGLKVLENFIIGT